VYENTRVLQKNFGLIKKILKVLELGHKTRPKKILGHVLGPCTLPGITSTKLACLYSSLILEPINAWRKRLAFKLGPLSSPLRLK